MSRKKRRTLSRAFTAAPGDPRLTIIVDRVPKVLKDRIKAKATRERVSLRPLILQWLTNWEAGRLPHDDGEKGPQPTQ